MGVDVQHRCLEEAQMFAGSRRLGLGLRVHGFMQELEEVGGTERWGKAPPHPWTRRALGWLSQGLGHWQASGRALASPGPLAGCVDGLEPHL